jgi:hypothetical protein
MNNLARMQLRNLCAVAAVLAVLVSPQAALPAKDAATPGARQAVEPRFETAWTDLNSALWMLTHTDAVHGTDPNYKQAVQSLYGAIGSMDDGITSSARRPSPPTATGNGRARLHAALNFLVAADRDLASPSHDPTAEPLRARALVSVRAAIAATRNLITECRC